MSKNGNVFSLGVCLVARSDGAGTDGDVIDTSSRSGVECGWNDLDIRNKAAAAAKINLLK